MIRYKHRDWIIVCDGLTVCRCGLCAGVVSTELWWVSNCITCPLVTMAKVHSGLRSLNFCSSICVVFFFVGKFVCKMIPKSSYCFLCCMVLVAVGFGLHFRIHVYCLEFSICMMRLGYLFWCILCVRDVVLLLIFQFDRHIKHYRFFILIYEGGLISFAST